MARKREVAARTRPAAARARRSALRAWLGRRVKGEASVRRYESAGRRSRERRRWCSFREAATDAGSGGSPVPIRVDGK